MTNSDNQNITQISSFRERIGIMELSQESNNIGGYSEIWTKKKNIWAYIRMLEIPETNNQIRRERLALYEIQCRFNNISAEDKILFRNLEGKIKTITELDNKKQFMSIIVQVILN